MKLISTGISILFICISTYSFGQPVSGPEKSIVIDSMITRTNLEYLDLLPYAWGRYQASCCSATPLSDFGTGNYSIDNSGVGTAIIFDEPVAEDLAVLVTPTFGYTGDIGLFTPQVNVDYVNSNTVRVITYLSSGTEFKGGFSFVAYKR